MPRAPNYQWDLNDMSRKSVDLGTRKLELNFTCHILTVSLYKWLDASKTLFLSHRLGLILPSLPPSSDRKGTKVNMRWYDVVILNLLFKCKVQTKKQILEIDQISITALSFPKWVTLHNSFEIFISLFLTLKNQEENYYFIWLSWRLNEMNYIVCLKVCQNEC